MAKVTPSIKVTILEGKDLIHNPSQYWAKYNRFKSVVKVDIPALVKSFTTKTATAEQKSPLLNWKEEFMFEVNLEKFAASKTQPSIDFEVMQKISGEYFEKDKFNTLSKFQILIPSLKPNVPFDSWIGLNPGYLHISILLSGFEIKPQPQVAQMPTMPQQHQQPPPQYQSPPQYQPSAPEVQLYPNLGNANQQAFPQQPQFLQQPLPVQPMVAPPLPPKNVSLPDHLKLDPQHSKKIIVCTIFNAKQPPTEKMLRDYFSFCGKILAFHFESEMCMLYFSHDYEAETALYLNQGMVCGVPIQVFKYEDMIIFINSSQKQIVEKKISGFIDSALKTATTLSVDAFSTQIPSQQSPSLPPSSESVTLPQETNQAKVFVNNVSSQATSSTLADFFSYCGKVLSVDLYDSGNGYQMAVVTLETVDAANTALLLNSALIFDRSIMIEAWNANIEASLQGKQKKSTTTGNSDSNNNNAPHGSKSKSSVVASMLAAGYNVGSNAVSSAKAYDQKHLNLQGAVVSAKEKILELDKKYKISDKAIEGKDYLVSSFQSLWKNSTTGNSQPKQTQQPPQ